MFRKDFFSKMRYEFLPKISQDFLRKLTHEFFGGLARSSSFPVEVPLGVSQKVHLEVSTEGICLELPPKLLVISCRIFT